MRPLILMLAGLLLAPAFCSAQYGSVTVGEDLDMDGQPDLTTQDYMDLGTQTIQDFDEYGSWRVWERQEDGSYIEDPKSEGGMYWEPEGPPAQDLPPSEEPEGKGKEKGKTGPKNKPAPRQKKDKWLPERPGKRTPEQNEQDELLAKQLNFIDRKLFDGKLSERLHDAIAGKYKDNPGAVKGYTKEKAAEAFLKAMQETRKDAKGSGLGDFHSACRGLGIEPQELKPDAKALAGMHPAILKGKHLHEQLGYASPELMRKHLRRLKFTADARSTGDMITRRIYQQKRTELEAAYDDYYSSYAGKRPALYAGQPPAVELLDGAVKSSSKKRGIQTTTIKLSGRKVKVFEPSNVPIGW